MRGQMRVKKRRIEGGDDDIEEKRKIRNVRSEGNSEGRNVDGRVVIA